MAKKTVIIGGVAGGATTAARLRRLDENMEILVLEKGDYISYANCGLPYYIGGVIQSRDALLLQTPEAMKQKFNIDIRTANEVTQIDPEAKTVTVKDLKVGNEYKESYDTLVIATGSSPLKPPIPGIDGPNIFTLWTIPDTDMIKAFVQERKPKRAAVIGGGFIGLEMAENLHEAGATVTVVEMLNQVMAPLDFEMAQLIHENMDMNGVELILGDGVESFENTGGATLIKLKSGRTLETDLVILSIGVKPNSILAKNAGLELNEKGGIKVDANLRTSNSDIFAVGDAIQVENFVLKTPAMIPLAGPANKQARICANNIAGGNETYNGTQGTSIAKVFDLAAATTGVNEKTLIAAGSVKGLDYFTAIINQKSHAGYYPNATPLTMKMIFDGEGRILGGQAVGQEGVDKRIDTLAATMRMGGSVYDLEELELAYAPPFSSAKDPVNMLGFVAENILKKMVTFIDCAEMDTITKNGDADYMILDIGEDMERLVFSIPGSYHIPLGQLRNRLGELDKNKLIIVYCAIGVRSYNAARILSQSGFKNIQVLSGGTTFYKSNHYLDFKSDSGLTSSPAFTDSGKDVEVKSEMKILNCSGLQCPGPIIKVNEMLQTMTDGDVLEVSATDMGFARDVEAWCRRTGNTLLKTERKGKENIVCIKKGLIESGSIHPVAAQSAHHGAAVPSTPSILPQGKTIIVFSGDLDKVLASFIIANGAAAMGRPVTMFFTFWGLNVLRKTEKQNIKKPFIERMFGAMMPQGTSELTLSNMNMGGMGTSMMKKVMKDKNVNSLEELMQQAMANGVKLIACTMSMDIMGITKEELIDGVEYAGVATYLGDAEESNVNLFI